MGIHDDTIKAIYQRGGERKEALQECRLNSNQVANVSTRLGLHWSWPLENRTSGVAPPKPPKKEKSPTPERLNKFAHKSPPRSATTTPKSRSKTRQKEELLGKNITPKRPPLTPSPSFSSARDRRERGIDESRFLPPRARQGGDDFEKFLHAHYAKQFE